MIRIKDTSPSRAARIPKIGRVTRDPNSSDARTPKAGGEPVIRGRLRADLRN
jgi:hypothetical protein